MADIELVIRIDEEIYQGAIKSGYSHLYDEEVANAVANGTPIEDIGEFSDGYHTFNSLYRQRMFLFAALVKAHRDKAWKSLRHEDGELCFGGGWFIVGIDTPEGSYTYHYEDNYYSLFDCEELERGKHWDGHTDADVKRLMSLKVMLADTTRDCKTCRHSKDGKCAFTEECHDCMWESKYIEADKDGEAE